MPVEVFAAGNPLTEIDIAKVEKRIKRPIPSAYRAFLLVHNGGYPDPCDFSILHKNGSSESISVEWFMGINVEEGIDLESYWDVYRNRIPSDLFSIATDPGGDLICIATDGVNANKVYFWDHEEESEESEGPTYNNVYFVAPDFQQFFRGLK